MQNDELELIESGPLSLVVKRPTAANGSPPVLCFLHGYDEGAPLDVLEGVARHGPLNPSNSALVEPFVVVAPQLPVRGDVWHHYAPEVRAIVEEAAARWEGDLHRLYLTGFSFGGNGVLDLAAAEPGLWAALWPVDPTRVPAGPVGGAIWLSLGELSRPNARGFIRTLGLEPAAAGPAEIETTTMRLGDRVWTDEAEDHVGTASRAYSDARIYRWLLARRS